jgi:PBP1b-binding outer membrane lipoprotein LpoB
MRNVLRQLSLWRTWFVLGLAALATGCASEAYVRDMDPSRPGTPLAGTGPESQDVLVIADKMMRSLLGTPAIANASRPPTIALIELKNKSRFAVNTDIFLRKLRVTLNSKAAGRMLFLDRENLELARKEREAKRAGELSADPALQQKAMAGADYFLTGNVDGLSKSSQYGREDYLLYTFRMVDAESTVVVWEDEYETKRVSQEDAVYR